MRSLAIQAVGTPAATAVPLVCFPHAGGTPAAFRGWDALLPGFRVHAANYPGRGRRMREDHPDDIVGLGRELGADIHALDLREAVLFGHSMGCIVAFEAALHLERLGTPCRRLIVSGSRNGPLPVPDAHDETESRETTLAHLAEMGGMPDAFFDDREFQDMVLSYILSDGAMFRRYRHDPASPLASPITSIVGASDGHADVRPWAALTRSDFDAHTVPGGHFYLEDAPPIGILGDLIAGADVPDDRRIAS